MKLTWWFVCTLIAAGLSAAERIPLEDFGRAPLVARAELSPDGQYVAFLRETEGKQTLFLTDLKTKQLSRIEPADMRGTFASKEVGPFEWVGDRRLVFTTIIWDRFISGMSAVDRDGRQWKTISGAEAKIPNEDRLFATKVIHRFYDQDQSILALGFRLAQGSGLSDENLLYPDVVKVNTFTGHYAVEAKNPGNVVAWGSDNAGCVRVGITADGLKFGTIYRDREDAPWRQLAALGEGRDRIVPLGFEGSSPRLYVAALSARKRWAIYPFDTANGTRGDVLMEDPDYDVVPESGEPAFDGIPLARPVFLRRRHTLAGVYYVTEGPRVRWFDPAIAALQRAIDRALPGTFNLITGGSRDDQRLLVLAYSDRDPGTYFLFDRADNSLTLVATRMGWIKPEQMAAMYPIKYPARDGRLIHGYLTFPPGAPHQHLPLVVLPHGGPWVRDVWGFDPLVQMLASRGYAVLQMNYRGSTGYGAEFSTKRAVARWGARSRTTSRMARAGPSPGAWRIPSASPSSAAATAAIPRSSPWATTRKSTAVASPSPA